MKKTAKENYSKIQAADNTTNRISVDVNQVSGVRWGGRFVENVIFNFLKYLIFSTKRALQLKLILFDPTFFRKVSRCVGSDFTPFVCSYPIHIRGYLIIFSKIRLLIIINTWINISANPCWLCGISVQVNGYKHVFRR